MENPDKVLVIPYWNRHSLYWNFILCSTINFHHRTTFQALPSSVILRHCWTQNCKC